MKVFLTGASGFIGQAVLRSLESKNYSVSTLSRTSQPAHGLQAEFSEVGKIKSFLLQEKPEAAVLLGWQGLPDYSLETCLLNLKQQLGIIEALIEAKCRRIILAGSCWQYGNVQGPVKETQPGHEVGVFGQTKNALYQLATSLAQGKETEIVEARIFYSYGPFQRESSLIPSVLTALKRGEKLTLRTPYDAVDFIYIDDVAESIECLVKTPGAKGIYNISNGAAQQISEVANMACDVLGQERSYPSLGATKKWWGDNSKLLELGYRPRVSLSEGIRRSLEGLHVK